MATKKGDSLIPEFRWMQNADEVIISLKIVNPEHVLVEIEKDKVYLKCVGGNKAKQLYEVTFYPLFKNIDREKSGFQICLNSSIIVVLFKIEKLMWPILTKGVYPPMTMESGQSVMEWQMIENVKLILEINNLELQLKGKNEKLKRFKKELNEKDEKIKALEKSISDKDKKLQVVEEMLKNVFDKNSKKQDEPDAEHQKLDNKSEELNLKVKEQNEKRLNLKQTVGHADKEGTEISSVNKMQKDIGLMEDKKQRENQSNQKLCGKILDKRDSNSNNMNTKVKERGEETEQGESEEKINSQQIGDVSIENHTKNNSNTDTNEQKELNKESIEEINKDESRASSIKPLVTISGETKSFIHAGISAITKIVVNDPSFRIKDIEAKVETLNGVKIPIYVFLGIAKRFYNINITPEHVGTHEIKVFVKKEFALSFVAEVYDTKLIKIDELRYGTVGRPLTFKVDVSKAGKGHLSVSISHEDLSIENKVEKLNDAIYVISFLPRLMGHYDVSVFYNGRMVKNSSKYTFSIEAFPSTLPILVDFPNGPNIQINKHYEFVISRDMFNSSDFKLIATVKTPSGKRIPCPLCRLDSFSIIGYFVPTEVGLYKINVKLNDEHLAHSPHYVKASYDNYKDVSDNLILYVDKSFSLFDKDNQITEYLGKVPVNEKKSFFIDFSGVKFDGIFKLDVLITDPENQQVPVFITGRGSSFLVDFILKIRGDHTLNVKFNDKIVKGTPCTIKAIDDYDLLD